MAGDDKNLKKCYNNFVKIKNYQKIIKLQKIMIASNGVNNEMDSVIPEGGAQNTPKVETPAKKTPAAKQTVKPATPAVRRPKPLVEGINAPKSTQDVIRVKPSLSPKEKELVSEVPVAEPEPKPSPNMSPAIASNFNNIEEIGPEPRLMPESVVASINKKSHHIGRWLLIFVVLLILVAGGYEFYVWELNKGQPPFLGHYHPSADNLAAQPFPLAGGLPPVSSSSTPPAVATTTPTSTPVVILQVKINSTPTGYLNVRDMPSSSGKVVTQVKPGEVYAYTQVKNNWYQITYSGFSQGWVSGQYVTKQ